MINILEGLTVPDDAILSVFDCTSMYTNVNFPNVLNSVQKAILASSIKYNIKKPPLKYFMELLKLSLENNFFEFEGEYWLQIIGIAMGAAHSPECSDLTLFEILNSIESKYEFMDKILDHSL